MDVNEGCCCHVVNMVVMVMNMKYEVNIQVKALWAHCWVEDFVKHIWFDFTTFQRGFTYGIIPYSMFLPSISGNIR
jgi:hypothetical protein